MAREDRRGGKKEKGKKQTMDLAANNDDSEVSLIVFHVIAGVIHTPLNAT